MGIIDDTITAIGLGNMPFLPTNPDADDANLIFVVTIEGINIYCYPTYMVATKNSIPALYYDGTKFGDIRAEILDYYSDFKAQVLSDLTAAIAALAS